MKYDVLPNWDFSIPVRLDIAKPSHCRFEVASLRGNIVGLITPESGGRYKLSVSSDELEMVQNFTKAYLLAEAIVYKPKKEVVVTRDNFHPTPSKFRVSHCQRLAMAYLMPKLALDYLILKQNYTDLGKLSIELNVSEMALHTRLQLLGWI